MRFIQQSMIAGLLIGLALITTPQVWATPAINTGQSISAIEQQIFAHSYGTESPESRLARLEGAVFGATSTQKTVLQRIDALKQVLDAHPDPATTPPPATASTPQQPNTPSNAPPIPTVAPNESDYPAISAMEQRVFQQTYGREAVELRLNRLESRVLGGPQRGTLQERTDQLRTAVGTPPDSSSYTATDPPQVLGSDSESYASQTLDPGSGSGDGMLSSQMFPALAKIEKRQLRKTYPYEAPESRLSRLETKLFKSTAPELTPAERFERIASVSVAQQSSRREQLYTSSANPFMRRTGPIYGTGMSPPGANNSGMNMSSLLLMILMSMF